MKHLSGFISTISYPSFPLGKKYIIRACSACEKYLEIPYKRWLTYKDAEFEKSKTAYLNNPHNRYIALAHLEKTDLYRNREEAVIQARQAEQDFKEDSAVITRLADWYYGSGQYTDALRCYEGLYSAHSDDDDIKSRLGSLCLKQDELMKARDYCLSIRYFNNLRDKKLFFELSRVFIELAAWQEAYSLLLFIHKRIPAYMKQDRSFKRQVKIVEKTLCPENSIISGLSTHSLIPALITDAAIALALFSNAILQNFQRLNIINFVNKPTVIVIDGKERIRLTAREYKKISLTESRHILLVRTEGQAEYEQKIDIVNSVFERYLPSNFFVFNVKGGGIILWEKLIYAVNPEEFEAGQEYKFYTGAEYYTFKNIDYPFTEPPAALKLVDSKDIKYRTSLSYLSCENNELLRIILDNYNQFDLTDILNFMETQLDTGYSDTTFINIYKLICEKNDALDRYFNFIENNIFTSNKTRI